MAGKNIVITPQADLPKAQGGMKRLHPKIGAILMIALMFNISQLTFSKEEKPMTTSPALKLTISSP
ncbi:MAG: hypothetical protein V1709_07110, partial [Planctomycetota bacterium]